VTTEIPKFAVVSSTFCINRTEYQHQHRTFSPQMRDALLDTGLEKQSETNSAMRNVRENLEVMSRAGDGPVTAGNSGMGGGRSGSVKMGGGGGGGMTSSASAGNMSSNNSYTSAASNNNSAAVAANVSTRNPTGSRKNSAANSGTRASVSSDSGLNMAEDEFGQPTTFSNNFHSGNSVGGNSSNGSAMAAVGGIGSVSFTRPSMVGQELRGTAPPSMSRESSVRGMGMGSRQSSIKGLHTHNAPHTSHSNTHNTHAEPPTSARGGNLQLGSPTHTTHTTHTNTNHNGHTTHNNTTTHTPHAHHAYSDRDSPEPAEFSSTIHSLPDIPTSNINNSGNYEQHSPRVAGVANKAVVHQQNTYSNHVAPVTHNGGGGGSAGPQGMNQVRLV